MKLIMLMMMLKVKKKLKLKSKLNLKPNSQLVLNKIKISPNPSDLYPILLTKLPDLLEPVIIDIRFLKELPQIMMLFIEIIPPVKLIPLKLNSMEDMEKMFLITLLLITKLMEFNIET